MAVIINPVSGAGGHAGAGAGRAETARRELAAVADVEIHLTAHAGHARELAAAALAGGADLVAAWGGDGTVNEVASVLAGQPVPLGIIPSGSGNGLARELGISLKPAAALAALASGRDRTLDVCELDGRPFVNVAGVGLDGRIAATFGQGRRRGLRRYVEVTLRELWAARPVRCTVSADGSSFEMETLLVALANSRQYGNGLLIAPDARLDDGRLDVVAVGARGPLTALRQMPWLFSGHAARVPGVRMHQAAEVEIRSAGPLACHVDGEPFQAGPVVTARVRPAALRVRVPA